MRDAGLAAVSAWRTVRTLGADRLNAVVLCLAGFTSISATMATLGRACGGPDAGTRSAYVAYVLPFLVALYLTVSVRVAGWAQRTILATLFLTLVVKEFAWTRGNSVRMAQHYLNGKRSWRDCYARTPDLLLCNQEFPLYPDPVATHLDEKMKFLRDRRAGPFREIR